MEKKRNKLFFILLLLVFVFIVAAKTEKPKFKDVYLQTYQGKKNLFK